MSIRSALMVGALAGALAVGTFASPAVAQVEKTSATGMTVINSSHSSTAIKIVRGYYGSNTRALHCYTVRWANSNHNWAYETTSNYAFRHGSECRPSDGNQEILRYVNGRWKPVVNVGSGSLGTSGCKALFASSLGKGASRQVRRDIYAVVAAGQCRGVA